jgi:hypothetical protein
MKENMFSLMKNSQKKRKNLSDDVKIYDIYLFAF